MNNKLQLSLILTVAVALPVILLTYDRIDLSLFSSKAEPPKPVKPEKPSQEARYQKRLDEGFKQFQQTYEEELAAYKSDIIEQWGEFKEAPPSVWISYEQSGAFRRSVDYESGKVQVEMIIDQQTRLDQVQAEVDKAVYRLMNMTEKSAYESDVVARRVEQKMADYDDLLQKGELSDQRLFSINDFLSLRIQRDGFVKVWYPAGNVAMTNRIPSAKPGKEIIRVSFKIPYSIHQKALKYAAVVKASAEKENINEELIYAIMETESSFNPMAKSYIPAYGLMQIVPRTAGKDATNYLYGKAKILAPSYLYQPKNNITIGAAYLHVLQYRYMRKVKNKESRMYCAIAAYNTGASNVAKAFINEASFNKAVDEINKLSPQQVYEKLKNYLPRKETRKYIEKVARRMQKYL